jgi:hypothetical protein
MVLQGENHRRTFTEILLHNRKRYRAVGAVKIES